jgi:MFS transporter, FHS family, glucose/mannose:H+ symporter
VSREPFGAVRVRWPGRPRAVRGTKDPSPSPSAVAAALALFLLLGAATASLGAALPVLRGLYHVSAATGGGLVSLYMLGALIAIVAGGFGETKLPPTRTITALLGVFAAGCLGVKFAPSWTLLQVVAVVAGAGFGGLALYLNTAFVQAFDQRGLLMLNLLNAAYGAGAVAGPVPVGLLVHVDVRLLFLACGMLAIACLPARDCGRVLARARPAATAGGWPGLRMVSILVPFAAISFFYEGLETGTGAWESTHLAWIGFPAGTAAQVTACYWAGLLTGRLVIPILTRRISPAAVVFCGVLFATAALCSTSLRQLAPFGYALTGFGLAPVFSAMLAWAARITPARQFANALMLSAAMVGGVLWPGFIGLVADPAFPATISFALAGIGGLCLMVAWNATRQLDGRQRDAENEPTHDGNMAPLRRYVQERCHNQ